MDQRLRDVEIELHAVAQRVNDHEGDFHRFASLPTELERIRWDLSKGLESLDAAHTAIRELNHRLDREHEERIEGQAERKAELEVQIAARNKEIADLRDRDEQRKLESRRMLYGLVGIFLTSAAAVLAPILTGGHP